MCAAGDAGQPRRRPEDRGALPGTAQAVRRRAGRAFSIAGRDRHPEPASHRVAPRPRRDGRAQARDGRSGAQRVARREQRARIDAAADPADAGGSSQRRARAGRVRGGSRARPEVAPGLPPDFRRDADVFAKCGAAERLRTGAARHRHGLRHPEVRHEPERHRAARERAGRHSGSRVQPERSRTGVPQPAHQRARGHAARRPDHGHRARRRPARRNLDRRYRMRDSPRKICRGCSSRSSRQSRTATASASRSAARFSGKSTARSRFRASPATAPTSAFSFRRRCRSRNRNRHESRPASSSSTTNRACFARSSAC